MPHHLGAAAAVITACVLSRVVNQFRKIYYKRLLPRNTDTHWLEECIFVVMTWCVTVADCLGLGRKTELTKVRTGKKLRERLASKSRTPALAPEEGKVLVETIVSAEDLSIWAMLMPAIYQLVPGSMIAKLWSVVWVLSLFVLISNPINLFCVRVSFNQVQCYLPSGVIELGR